MAVHPRVVGVRDQLAEALAEGLVALDGDVLVAEEERAVGHQGLVQDGEAGIGEVTEIDSTDGGADYGRRGRDGDGGSTHGG